MTRPRTHPVVLAMALFAACGGAPPAPVPVAPQAPSVAERQETVATATAAAPLMAKLDNGLLVAITASPPGSEAQLQLGMFAGALLVAPGLAELSAQVLIHGADPSQGRQSLVQAMAKLGGTVQWEVGPLTTWILLRVPGSNWEQAQAALRRALAAPTQSRSQIERIREDFVQQRCATIRRDPATAMAQVLLQGETGTATYVTSLLDRDPSEISLFQSRLHRPERSVLALHVPGDPAQIAAALSKGGDDSLASWSPPALTPTAAPVLDRSFSSGLYWAPVYGAPGKPGTTCRIAFVLLLPDLATPDAADLLTLHACLTLDGAGGRLEQLQRERGLGHVRWHSDFVQTPDALAIVLSADVAADEPTRLWQTLQLARQSLRDIPPGPSELELALRRARLTARFGQLDATRHLRSQTGLRLRGTSVAALEPRFQFLAQPGSFDWGVTAANYLKLPAAAIVIGGELPTDIEGVHAFEVLPKAFAADVAATASTSTATVTPWLEQAIEALGGASLLRRFAGLQAEARLANDRAPAATERVVWQTDGTLARTRELLGSKIETQLQGSTWTEQLGDKVEILDSRQAAFLRREMQRHPVALLAAFAADELQFRAVAQRNVGDRDLMVLEAIGDRFDRLRIHVDTISHLVRVVEVWETMPDGTSVHLQDAWSDYRSTGGLRAPFRRLTTQDDGQNRVETVFSKWVPKFSAP